MHTYELQTQKSLKQICHHELETQMMTNGTHRNILAISKSNFKDDSTLHYYVSMCYQPLKITSQILKLQTLYHVIN